MPEEQKVELLGRFVNIFTYKRNPLRDWGSNREFNINLTEALEKDEAYTSLSRLLMLT